MPAHHDARRAWGERTRGQRIATYAFFLAFSLVCLVLWATNTVEPNAGAARYGEVVFAVGVIVFSIRLARELRT
jgi:hypothetical protein